VKKNNKHQEFLTNREERLERDRVRRLSQVDAEPRTNGKRQQARVEKILRDRITHKEKR